jgi:hypothetical protein
METLRLNFLSRGIESLLTSLEALKETTLPFLSHFPSSAALFKLSIQNSSYSWLLPLLYLIFLNLAETTASLAMDAFNARHGRLRSVWPIEIPATGATER